MDLAEDKRSRRVAWVAEASNACGPESLKAFAVYIEHTEARGYHPYMSESNAGELAAPQEGQRNGTEQS